VSSIAAHWLMGPQELMERSSLNVQYTEQHNAMLNKRMAAPIQGHGSSALVAAARTSPARDVAKP